MYTKDTIAAICTPPGEGGVALIRISGPEALAVAGRIFSGEVTSFASHTVHYGTLFDGETPLDQVLLTVMHNPRSYTGEDTVEICCHGGSILSRRVLQTILAAGARAAGPGEFTFRAYMNGKIDLAQAEAVQGLIHARNEQSLAHSEQQLKGRLSKKIKSFQKELTGVAAVLEAWVDFPEEGLEFASLEELLERLEAVKREMKQLAETFHEGRILHEGLTVCLVGSPNVGKSSLMNALLDRDRAIVSDIAGTTRDTLEDHLRLNGLNLRLIDTAGVRETAGEIEQEGIRRTYAAIEEADLILLVLDAARGLNGEEREWILKLPPKKTLAIWNKIDLRNLQIEPLPLAAAVELSAKEKLGLEELHRAIDQVIWRHGAPSKEELILTNVRHKQALDLSIAQLDELMDALKQNISPECLMVPMRCSLFHLGQVIGVDVGEEILSAIFSTFCVGK